ncbi:MAG TPA: OmpH family outer membrane protein [Bryobacteraceae bacterium]|nr:OmpH family outer membrane protein [Bryobacteraceae bacterium]
MLRFSLVLLASLAIAPAQIKVAIINVQSAILDTAEIKKAQAELEARYKPRQLQIEKLQKELADLQNQLQAGQGKLTPQAEQNLQATGQRKQRELQRLGEDLQADVDRDRNDILQKSGGRMTDVVKKLAEERGLDMVVDVTNTIYYKPALEMTKDATTAYDKTYPAK